MIQQVANDLRELADKPSTQSLPKLRSFLLERANALQIEGDVESAIAGIEHSRQTHINWIEHLKECHECPHASVAGPIEHHEKCVAKYDNVLNILRSLR